jgi:hypothetical protein
LSSFEGLLPPFERIVKEYGIEPPVAFYLWRPILAEKIRQYDVDLSIQLQKKKLLQGLAANEKAGDTPEDSAEQSPTTDNVMQDVSQTAPPSTTTDDIVGLTEDQSEISPAPELDEYSPLPSSVQWTLRLIIDHGTQHCVILLRKRVMLWLVKSGLT